MGPDTRTRCTTLARCWRGSCYGFGFAASAIFLFVMMWLLWCYVGLVAIPTTEPQRRGLVHYASTTSKPSFTTSNNTTPSSQTSTLNSIVGSNRPNTTPLRGNSRGEAQSVRTETIPSVRTLDSSSKGDFNSREILAKPTTNSSADRSKGTSSESGTDSKRYDNERQRVPSMDSILVRSVSSSAPENLPDSKDDRHNEKPSNDRGNTETRDYNVETTEKNRKSEVLPARDEYDDDRNRRRRPDTREYYDDFEDKPRDYAGPARRNSDRRISDPRDIRDDPVRRRQDDDRDYDRRPVDRDRPRYDRDSSDYPRRRYDDIDDKGRPPSRRIDDDDDIRVRERDREPVRRVDDDYYRPRPPPRDDDRIRGDVYERRPLTDPYKDRDRDDSYPSTDDRYKYRSRPDDKYVDRDDRYRSTDDDDYRRDRYRGDDRYRDRVPDDRYRTRIDREEDRFVARPVDDTYRSRPEPDTSARREEVRPRGDAGTYRDEIEPRRTMDPLPISRDERPLPVARDPIDYEPRTRDDIDRRENLRKSNRDDPRLDVPKRAGVVEDRYSDRDYDRRRPASTTYSSSRDDYEGRDKALPLDTDEYKYRERTRSRDDPRYEEDSTIRRSRPRYDADSYRSKGEERIDDDRYRRRRIDDEIPPRRVDDDIPPRRVDDDIPPRRDDDYRGSRAPTSKGDERVIDRDSTVYLAEDRELSKGIRTKPEDVILDHRSYSTSDDDYVRNRPRIDPKLSSDRDDREESYRPPRRRVSEDPIDDRYDSRSKDRYDADDYRSRGYDRDYDRTDDRRYTRTDSRDVVRPTRPDPVDRVRETIQSTRTISDDRLIRPSSRDSYPDETRSYISDPRPSRLDDDEYSRRDSVYNRPTESRLKREPEEVRSPAPRSPDQTNIREKRYQESDDPCRNTRMDDASRNYRKGCIESSLSSSSSSPSRSSADSPVRPLTPKEVIDAAYRHRDETNRPGANIYPVFDPRVHNISSPEVIRPNERRGTTIQTRKKKK